MMKRILFLTCIAWVSVPEASGQYEQHVWAFGSGAGLDFNTSIPVPVASNLFPGLEGCASICDAGGRLLFYSNGYWVWDGDHYLMPQLTAGVGGYTGPSSGGPGYPPLMTWTGEEATQAAAICGMPAHPGKYYLFSLNSIGRLFYTQIDMSLHGGKGDIVPGKKGIYLDGGLAEKMTVVKGCNNIWLIVRSLTVNAYKAYEINDTGIVPVPVLSYTGLLPSSSYRCGVIKFSPDGTKMAAACNLPHMPSSAGIAGGLELYDFDPFTGKISNARLLDSSDTLGNYYGACFSPDGSKLYASTSSMAYGNIFYYGKVRQFDLSSGALPAIVASNTVVFTDVVYHAGNTGDLKRGPDGKIWFGSGGAYPPYNPIYMHVINFPNLAGAACGMTPNAIAMLGGGRWTYRGLPNDIALIDAPDTVSSSKNITVCFKDSLLLAADSGKRHRWQDGTPGNTITARAGGQYIVSFINTSCQYETDTYRVHFVPVPVAGSAGYSCPGSGQGTVWVRPYNSDTSTIIYTWKDARGSILRQHTGNEGDTLRGLDTGSYIVQISTPSGCDTTLQLSVLPMPVPQAAIIADETGCKDVPLSFSGSTDAPVWEWQFGDGAASDELNPQHTYPQPGNYTVIFTATSIEGCSATAIKEITVKTLDIQLISDKALVSRGETVHLQTSATEPYTIITWSPAYLFPDQTGLSQTVTMDTTHTFTVTGHDAFGCAGEASVQVSVRAEVTMPDAFSPNNDGVNDRFRPVSTGYVYVHYFRIYNRYGQLVYAANGAQALQGWDGTFNGELQDVNTYYYQISAGTKEGKTLTLKGDVSLLR